MTAALAHPQAIPTSQLMDWIPHRPPMIWVDAVARYDAQGGECFVHVKEGSLYMDANGLRASSLIEFIAQSYGYIGVCNALEMSRDKVKKATKAFLVAITQTEFGDCSRVAPGMTLRVRIGNAKQVGPITLFDGQVIAPDGLLLLKASLKVYAE